MGDVNDTITPRTLVKAIILSKAVSETPLISRSSNIRSESTVSDGGQSSGNFKRSSRSAFTSESFNSDSFTANTENSFHTLVNKFVASHPVQNTPQVESFDDVAINRTPISIGNAVPLLPSTVQRVRKSNRLSNNRSFSSDLNDSAKSEFNASEASTAENDNVKGHTRKRPRHSEFNRGVFNRLHEDGENKQLREDEDSNIQQSTSTTNSPNGYMVQTENDGNLKNKLMHASSGNEAKESETTAADSLKSISDQQSDLTSHDEAKSQHDVFQSSLLANLTEPDDLKLNETLNTSQLIDEKRARKRPRHSEFNRGVAARLDVLPKNSEQPEETTRRSDEEMQDDEIENASQYNVEQETSNDKSKSSGIRQALSSTSVAETTESNASVNYASNISTDQVSNGSESQEEADVETVGAENSSVHDTDVSQASGNKVDRVRKRPRHSEFNREVLRKIGEAERHETVEGNEVTVNDIDDNAGEENNSSEEDISDFDNNKDMEPEMEQPDEHSSLQDGSSSSDVHQDADPNIHGGEIESSLADNAAEDNTSANQENISSPSNVRPTNKTAEPVKPKRVKKPTNHAAMPRSFTKKLFKHFARFKLSDSALHSLENCTSQYMKWCIDKLDETRREKRSKVVTVADVMNLMKQQGFVRNRKSFYIFVEKYLPMEIRSLIIPVAKPGNSVSPYI